MGKEFERVPLGKYPKKVEISAEEMHLAWLHRQETGEPIQSFIRRLVREHWRAQRSVLFQPDLQATPREAPDEALPPSS